MGNLSESIKSDLVQLNGKSADHITHALKRMSGSENGTMAEGLIKLTDAFIKDKKDSVSLAKKTYGVGGFALGTLLTGGIAVGMYFYNKNKDKKEIQLETDRIQQIMHEEVESAKLDDIRANTNIKLDAKEEKLCVE